MQSHYGRRAWEKHIAREACIDAVVALSTVTLFTGGCLGAWQGIESALSGAEKIGLVVPDQAGDWISGAVSDAAKRHEWVSGAAQGRGQ